MLNSGIKHLEIKILLTNDKNDGNTNHTATLKQLNIKFNMGRIIKKRRKMLLF
jgi:hypothetical protein